MDTRVRFAPSPTGYLHVGGARTALFNWLVAKQTGGKLILRIEDTDRHRSTDDSILQILDSLKWLGIDYDEYYRQTERLELYTTKAKHLLNCGRAYWCDCSSEQLNADRVKASIEHKKPMYSGHCRNRKVQQSENTVLRFAIDKTGSTSFNDTVRGTLTVNNTELEDFVILRSDGSPTYNFCVVIDDSDMRITQVIRGEDHISNTFKQIQIYRALQETVPKFAHIPLILGSDKQRMSKRHGASSVLEYKELGYLPDVLINYLALLGWSNGRQEEFTREELIAKFTLQKVSKSNTVFDIKKLQWLNGRAMQKLAIEDIGRLIGGEFNDDAIKLYVSRSKTLAELRSQLEFLHAGRLEYSTAIDEIGKVILQDAIDILNPIAWDRESITRAIKHIEDMGHSKMQIGHSIRLALTGSCSAPNLTDLMLVMGKCLVLDRLRL